MPRRKKSETKLAPNPQLPVIDTETANVIQTTEKDAPKRPRRKKAEKNVSIAAQPPAAAESVRPRRTRRKKNAGELEAEKQSVAAASKTTDNDAQVVKPKRTHGSKSGSVSHAESIILQYGNSEWDLLELKKKVAAVYIAEGHRWGSVKSLTIYVKPEESKCYYVINGKTTGSIDFELRL